MTVTRKLTAGFAVPLVVLVVIGWAAYGSITTLLESAKLVGHTHEVRGAIGDVLVDVLNAETRQRGYLITHASEYEAPFHESMSRIDADLNALASLIVDAGQQQRLQPLKELVTTKKAQMNVLMQAAQEGKLDSAAEKEKVLKGRNYTEEIRTAVRELEAGETALLKQRQASEERMSANTLNTILYGTILAFLVVGAVGVYVSRSITVSVGELTNNLASSTAEILAGTTQQASGAQEQAAAVTETVATVDEVVQTSEQAAQRAKAVAESSQRAVEVGKAGRRAVDETVTAMGAVKEQSESIAESILALAEQAQAIGEIIATVNDIAEQTNLLALNAAIEASRAGEQGKGFAVVAGEIKALADQSKKATGQVRQILGEIQKATNSSVLLTEEGTKSVAAALKAVSQAGETIKALAETITEAAQAATQIAASAGQQATGMSQIHQAMKNVNQVTNQNLASTKQAERAAQDLNALGVKLKQLVGS